MEFQIQSSDSASNEIKPSYGLVWDGWVKPKAEIKALVNITHIIAVITVNKSVDLVFCFKLFVDTAMW